MIFLEEIHCRLNYRVIGYTRSDSAGFSRAFDEGVLNNFEISCPGAGASGTECIRRRYG